MLIYPLSTGVTAMKNLSFFVSAFAICASTSYAAIDCSTLPTCASLGYNDVVSQCPKNFNGKDAVIKCPFDTTQGKCIYEAAVGQIAYFTKAPNPASGWLKCDGLTFTKNKYPELYAFIGQQFCNAYNGGTCGTDVGRLPKYTGLFLRVSGIPTGYGKTGYENLATPQAEGLPNITGRFMADDSMIGNNNYDFELTGAFYKYSSTALSYDVKSTDSSGGGYMGFDASRSNKIYGSSSGVTPPNIAVYAYIYAGKVVQ